MKPAVMQAAAFTGLILARGTNESLDCAKRDGLHVNSVTNLTNFIALLK